MESHRATELEPGIVALALTPPTRWAPKDPETSHWPREIGDGWLPIFYSPRMADTYNEWLDEGFARPGTRCTRENFEICATANIVVTDARSGDFEAMRPSSETTSTSAARSVESNNSRLCSDAG